MAKAAKKPFRVKTIKVSRLKANPENRYENERIEVEVEVPAGRTAAEAIQAGRQFIAKQFGETPTEEQIAEARRVIDEAERVPLLI